MRTFEFVVAIVAIVFTYRALAIVFGHRRHKDDDARAQGQQEEMESRLTGLEDRVRVLERIVTDTKSDLERQFRDLE